MEVENHSRTWKAVEAFIAQEKADAVQYLIADINSEQQRGAIKVLERLLALPRQEGDEG